jgi:hypothetical protein
VRPPGAPSAGLIVVLLALSVVGCGTAASYGPSASCAHPTPTDKAPAIGLPELVGHGTEARLWGLVMARRYPIVAGEGVVKIVWHMTGQGALTLAEYERSGRRIPLAWGPVAHGSSNYDRPGSEWGAGYRFPNPGCYRLTARRARGRGTVWLQVRSAS